VRAVLHWFTNERLFPPIITELQELEQSALQQPPTIDDADEVPDNVLTLPPIIDE
jgi:hypothetical protein